MASRGSKSKDAIELLKSDHRKVEEIFERFEKAKKSDEKEELVRIVCRELKIHAQIEEEIFYPALRQKIDETDLLDEAQVEHACAKQLIQELENGELGDELYEAKVKVLSEYVKHHVDEEETEIFPAAESANIDTAELGEKLMSRKQQLTKDTEEFAAE